MKSNDIDLKGRGGEKAARGAAFLKDMLFGFAYSAIAVMLDAVCCRLERYLLECRLSARRTER